MRFGFTDRPTYPERYPNSCGGDGNRTHLSLIANQTRQPW